MKTVTETFTSLNEYLINRGYPSRDYLQEENPFLDFSKIEEFWGAVDACMEINKTYPEAAFKRDALKVIALEQAGVETLEPEDLERMARLVSKMQARSDATNRALEIVNRHRLKSMDEFEAAVENMRQARQTSRPEATAALARIMKLG